MPVALVWLLLIGASVFGFALAEGLAPPRLATCLAILLAAAKIKLVFGQYMEVRWSQRPLRPLLTAWLAVVTTILLAGYLTT